MPAMSSAMGNKGDRMLVSAMLVPASPGPPSKMELNLPIMVIMALPALPYKPGGMGGAGPDQMI